MQTALCPECGSDVTINSDPKMGKLVTCKKCSTELEIVWLDPLELDFPFGEDEYEEDLDYDFEE